MSYRWCIESEHINVPREILEECGAYFRVVRRRYFPLRGPADGAEPRDRP